MIYEHGKKKQCRPSALAPGPGEDPFTHPQPRGEGPGACSKCPSVVCTSWKQLPGWFLGLRWGSRASWAPHLPSGVEGLSTLPCPGGFAALVGGSCQTPSAGICTSWCSPAAPLTSRHPRVPFHNYLVGFKVITWLKSAFCCHVGALTDCKAPRYREGGRGGMRAKLLFPRSKLFQSLISASLTRLRPSAGGFGGHSSLAPLTGQQGPPRRVSGLILVTWPSAQTPPPSRATRLPRGVFGL